MHNKKTLVLGASTKPGRYALMAAERLLQKGHTIELLGKNIGNVGGVDIKTNTDEIEKDIDTVTVYLSEPNQQEYEDFLLKMKPKRVIFNPGAENLDLEAKLEAQGTEVIEACTLVMLGTGQY
ncbi:CoA-binding protein [Lacihabitans soyangensis]|uniref:CoA-binding protein n=1 Tax=Lacihabitans soyangensis TaxID=869394 RepID=A0AAE3H0S3_9BACT|nr:CoA-binding protein [Lacihabitans soyangensis]MCP9762618.1 CoA-binding protein [Lacihabitans soyangensis]